MTRVLLLIPTASYRAPDFMAAASKLGLEVVVGSDRGQPLAELFPGRLYVELMRHELPEEGRIESALVDLAYDQALPLVATNECFFADETMYQAHDALLCIAEGAYVAQQQRRRVG